MNPKATFTAAFLMMITSILIATISACKSSEVITPDSDVYDVVIARVGDQDIAMSELFLNPQVYVTIDQQLIMPKILEMETAKRGVEADKEEIGKQMEAEFNKAGGFEKWADSQGSSMPRNLLLKGYSDFLTGMQLQQKLMENVWETEHLPIPEARILQMWTQAEDRYRNTLANDLDKPKEEITMEDAISMMEAEEKNMWLQDQAQKFWDDLRAQYDVQFYLKDQWEQKEGIEVPLINPADSGGETEEHGGEEAGTGLDDGHGH